MAFRRGQGETSAGGGFGCLLPPPQQETSPGAESHPLSIRDQVCSRWRPSAAPEDASLGLHGMTKGYKEYAKIAKESAMKRVQSYVCNSLEEADGGQMERRQR